MYVHMYIKKEKNQYPNLLKKKSNKKIYNINNNILVEMISYTYF